MIQPFDGMKERRDRPLYTHQQVGVGYITDAIDGAGLVRKARTEELAYILADRIDPAYEDVVYDAVDELRRRWAMNRPLYTEGGFGLATLKSEGAAIPVDPGHSTSYRQAIADRDEFGKTVIRLRRRLRKVKRKLRRLRHTIQERPFF